MRVTRSTQIGLLFASMVSLTIVVGFAFPATGDDSEVRERVILMTSGRVLTGFASRNAGGWLVEQSSGRVQVPLEQVNVVANSMVDCYRKQRDAVVEPTPATHVALAQWCISYRLHGEARDELRKCLKLDPDHSSARKLLRRLDDMLDPPNPKSSSQERVPLRNGDGFLVPDVESLGGLSNDAAVSFTQRIQPLLMNKCGNAACHGSTTPNEKSESFRLLAVRANSAGHRIYTERNLAEVLRYIDLQDPALSPLTAIPQGAHGGTAGIFHGTTGNTQLKMLRAWIKTVAQEKRTEEQELAERPTITTKLARAVASARPEVSPLDDVADFPPEGPVEVKPASDVKQSILRTNSTNGRTPAELTSNQRDAQPIVKKKETTRDEPTNDPFDPDIFNRRFHSKPR